VTGPANDDVEALSALADAIIPADARDAGASGVDAGRRLAARVPVSAVYRSGLEAARALASEGFGASLGELSPEQARNVLDGLLERAPAFFKQLRMDVSALYLGDPRVSRAIGFPGPSIEQGGYPDFDQPQPTDKSDRSDGSRNQ
jgi:hypothetical protein